MDVDLFKIVGLISALFAIGEKVYTYAKKWRESHRQALLKKTTQGSLDYFEEYKPHSLFSFPIGPVGTREEVIEQLSKTVPRRMPI
jgi:hypothetical protein